MYAQNLGSKAVVVMQSSMSTWLSKGKMTKEQALSTAIVLTNIFGKYDPIEH